MSAENGPRDGASFQASRPLDGGTPGGMNHPRFADTGNPALDSATIAADARDNLRARGASRTRGRGGAR